MTRMRVMRCIVGLCLAAGSASAQTPAPVLSSEGAWTLRRADGASACILVPKVPSRVQVVGNRLEVTGLPRESIFNYQYRIDDRPVSNAAFPPPEMQKAGVIRLEGDAFDAVLGGKRLQIRILDKWHEAITEDVSLDGLRGLYDRMKNHCK